MIKSQYLIPNVYFNESRDFQYFGRLYDIIFNYIKTNTDLMENFPLNQNTDSKLIELLARTLGFENKINYRNDDLNAICHVFSSLIKYKGTKKAIDIVIKTILNVENIKENYYIIINNSSAVPVINIYIPDNISNSEIKLMEDILEYILPVGCLYNVYTTHTQNATSLTLNISQYIQADKIKYKENTNVHNGELLSTTKEKSSGDHESVAVINPYVGDIRFSKLNEGDN